MVKRNKFLNRYKTNEKTNKIILQTFAIFLFIYIPILSQFSYEDNTILSNICVTVSQEYLLNLTTPTL